MTVNEQLSPTQKMIAGFWIRVVADAIDMAILWGSAWLLSLLMEGWFVQLGENGVWLGLCFSIAYFVPSQSKLGGGQSLGKRILGIQVLDLEGRPLTLTRSFLRYLLIAFVGYVGVFTGIVNSIVGSSLFLFADSIVGTLWLMAIAGCYLLVPFHPLKRGLHDLAAGSVVVYRNQFNAESLRALNNPARTKKAFVLVGVVSAAALVFGILGFKEIMRDVSFTEMQEIQTKLESTGKFSTTVVSDRTFSAHSVTTRSMIVQAHVDGPLDQTREQLKPLYDLAFQAIREQLKDISKYNSLRVGLRMGYNLGIRKKYVTLFEDEDPNKAGERKNSGDSRNF